MNDNINNNIRALTDCPLFELVPFNIALIDGDYNIVTANTNFEDYFGDWQGRKCYQVYKQLPTPCPDCQAAAVFKDGRVRVSDETGTDRHNRTCHYVVHYAPIKDNASENAFILEMSTDITETKRWQRQYNLLFERAACYISVIDRNYRIIRANEAMRRTFGEVAGMRCYQAFKQRRTACPKCPARATFEDGKEHSSQQTGVAKDGSEAHYIVSTSPLSQGGGKIQHVIEIATDITLVHQLEKDKLDAERLAAVGQTVAGLAHTIKNLLMGLEGGMYIVDSGIHLGKPERVTEGWEILQRNFEKTTTLVKDFLSFAKGKKPVLKRIDPSALLQSLLDLYKEAARKQGVDLQIDIPKKMKKYPLDPEGIEACLTNLISNGIDAAAMRENGGGQVIMKTFADKEELIFEVTDNGCGMDAEVKQKVFTTFFTTKGGKGTGLGLLTTRKIIQEHGGSIAIATRKGEGSVFTVNLPLKRLNAIEKEQKPQTIRGAL